jgi:SAM-dependent methyltransferase
MRTGATQFAVEQGKAVAPTHSPMTTTDYSEFNDPRLASLYDVLCPMGEDTDFFLKEVADLSPQSIIDLGCGTGALTCELAGRGYRMTGIEPARAMLDIAQCRSCQGSVNWILGGHEKLRGLQADLVLMTAHVAQFMLEEDQWLQALAAIHDALTPGGHLLFHSRNPLVKPWERYTKAATRKIIGSPSRGRIETWIQTVRVDGNRATHQIHYAFMATGEELISTNELVYRSREELVASLEQAGLPRKASLWRLGPKPVD